MFPIGVLGLWLLCHDLLVGAVMLEEDYFDQKYANWYFSVPMLRGYLRKRRVDEEEIERLVGVFVEEGIVWVKDFRFRRVCVVKYDNPCRHCGGTGHVLVAKMWENVEGPCDRCGSKGYKPIGPDEDTILEP